MRKFKQFVLFIVLGAVISFTSCSDDDGDENVQVNAAAGTMVATVDGAQFESLNISSSATLANNSSGSNLIIIASATDASAFSFTILGYNGPGTYKFDGSVSTGVNVASYSETAVDISNPQNSTTEIWQAPYENLEVGSIIISEETDNNVKGSFEFDAKNLAGDGSIKVITNGSFDLTKSVI